MRRQRGLGGLEKEAQEMLTTRNNWLNNDVSWAMVKVFFWYSIPFLLTKLNLNYVRLGWQQQMETTTKDRDWGMGTNRDESCTTYYCNQTCLKTCVLCRRCLNKYHGFLERVYGRHLRKAKNWLQVGLFTTITMVAKYKGNAGYDLYYKS